MRTDYETDVFVDLPTGDGDELEEVRFTIGLQCTAASFAGCFDPRWGGEPPSGPEFEVTYIAREQPDGKSADLSWDDFENLVGRTEADGLFDVACERAAETGEF